MYRVAARLQRALALGLIAISCPIAAAQAQVSVLAPLTAPTSVSPPTPAQPTANLETGQLQAADTLRPGQYRWQPEAASADGPISIIVSIPLQRAWVFRAGALIGLTTVSTGQPGYDTPTGTFPILQKKVDHRSNLYDDAPMPFMQRLTWDGVAIHAGRIPGEPASHGCIRLPRAFARQLYGVTALGTVVTVTDAAPASPEEALALVATARSEVQLSAAD
jgi:lipoprotein-anchoring transpeptidase ErfK/SrfK